MKILSIETSCDETAISLVEARGGLKNPRFKIMESLTLSQINVHSPFGGVVPSLAKREHQKNLVYILKNVLKKAGCLKKKSSAKTFSKKETNILKNIFLREPDLFENFIRFFRQYKISSCFDAIAATAGPGLEPALWVGVNFSRALSFVLNRSIIAINHIEGHIISNWLGPVEKNKKSKAADNLPFRKKTADKNFKIKFPAICLVASGGHTQLVLVGGFGKYKIVGETQDDAVGEAFDKVAKMLGFGYPGGQTVAYEAEKIKDSKKRYSISLPRPMFNSKNFDFSFSGLKTAVLYKIQKLKKPFSADLKREMCFEFQQACVDVLVSKTLKAAERYGVKSVILGGGVAANVELRKKLEKEISKKLPNTLYSPVALEFCGDNADMIGAAAYLKFVRLKKNAFWIGGN